MKSPKKAQDGRKLIIGIDFGTTYSGIAWAETKQPDRNTAITTWPVSATSPEGESSAKVPTKLRYTKKEVQWGFSIPGNVPENEVVEWFKLDLDKTTKAMTQSSQKLSARGGRAPAQLVTDFMERLGAHLHYILQHKLGDAVLKSTPMEFVVTVPAMWSDSAKDLTRQACQNAPSLGANGRLIHLVSEPEAAALYALQGLDPHGLKVNQTILLVDAGGGTVDLIAYRIRQLKPILELEEAAPGTGGICGSSWLNRRFEKFLQDKLCHLDGFGQEVVYEAVDVFEKKIKRQFASKTPDNETFTIPLGGVANSAQLGVRRGRFAMKASDVREIFNPVVNEIIKLIKAQLQSIKTPVTVVLLVGGFGASMYLRDRITDAVGKTVRVLQPPNAWQAVVQGAVLKSLANNDPKTAPVAVRARKARRSYGVLLRAAYQHELHAHLAHLKDWDEFAGCHRVPVMYWFGDAVLEDRAVPISYEFTQHVHLGRPFELEMAIKYDRANRTLAGAVITQDKDVLDLSTLRAGLGHIPEESLSQGLGADGSLYYRLQCEVHATFKSASTEYSLYYNGRRYHTVTCEYA
ncbi:uncharacterized protein F5Z01DRAFT_741648 [Emericellopsis atlantica]|uniref:Uncharacterized protein n=1 Tax=Emericellopsis atlantica TaxID=2614577 RepID=A0A9P7ZU08_9HYPO|nr:uncharacterized protein F5Z01DRAFT_741648 [Emericellopsis atlantica]KAG9257747.1 hypothetical protein F5Z01DRAFT_741648 [Emericellopsis atlantica]